MKITHKRQYEQLKVYINGALHLHIKLLDLVGFQSWIHGSNEYFIEYYFKDGVKITTAYGSEIKWKQMLSVLDKELTVIG